MTLRTRVEKLEASSHANDEPIIILRSVFAPGPKGPISKGIALAHTPTGTKKRQKGESESAFLERVGLFGDLSGAS